MKYYLSVVIVLVLTCFPHFTRAEPGDISEDIMFTQSADMVRMEKIVFNAKYKYCEIFYRRCIEDNGTIVEIQGSSGRVKVRIADILDDPFTEDNETDLAYTELIDGMGGDGLKTMLVTVTKTILGIE